MQSKQLTPIDQADHLLGDRRMSWKMYASSEVPPAALITAAMCVPVIDDTFVIVRHVGRGWEFPGGHVNSDESLSETARREVKEETGFEVGEPVFFGYQEIHYIERVKNYPFPTAYISYGYAPVISEERQPPVSEEEIAEVGIFSFEDASSRLYLDFQKLVLSTAQIRISKAGATL